MQKTVGRFQMIVFVITLLFSVAGLFLLPETVAVQWNENGVSNYLPRWIACWIPAVVSVLCLGAWRFSSVRFQTAIDGNRKFCLLHTIAWGIISCIGLALHLVLFVTN